MLNDPVDYGIAHLHIRGSHIYFGPENTAPLIKFTCIHFFKKSVTFRNAPVAERTLYPWLGGSPFLCRYDIGRLIIYISETTFNEINGEIVQFTKIIDA